MVPKGIDFYVFQTCGNLRGSRRESFTAARATSDPRMVFSNITSFQVSQIWPEKAMLLSTQTTQNHFWLYWRAGRVQLFVKLWPSLCVIKYPTAVRLARIYVEVCLLQSRYTLISISHLWGWTVWVLVPVFCGKYLLPVHHVRKASESMQRNLIN